MTERRPRFNWTLLPRKMVHGKKYIIEAYWKQNPVRVWVDTRYAAAIQSTNKYLHMAEDNVTERTSSKQHAA